MFWKETIGENKMKDELIKCYLSDVPCGDCEHEEYCNITIIMKNWKQREDGISTNNKN